MPKSNVFSRHSLHSGNSLGICLGTAGFPGSNLICQGIVYAICSGKRPLVAYIRSIFCRERVNCNIPFPALINLESKGIDITSKVHIDNGTSVTGDGLSGVVFLKLEIIAIIGLNIARALIISAQRDRLTGGAGGGALALIAVAIVVGVLTPVDDGIGRIGFGSPDRIQGNVSREGTAKTILLTLQCPAAKLIAGLLGIIGSSRGLALIEEVRLHDGAAIGIIGDPEALDNNGVERDVLFGDGQFIANITLLFLDIGQAPSVNALIGTDGEAHIGGNNVLAIGILLGNLDTALIIHEVHIVDFLKLSRVGILFVADGRKLGGVKLDTITEPAGELVALLLGRGGGVDSLARLDLLGAHRHTVHHKLVGVDFGRGVHDIHFVDIRPRFRLHIADGEGMLLGGLRREGQELGSALAGEKPQLGAVGQERRAGDGAVHSGQGHFGAGLAGDGDGVDLGVGERHLRPLRGFLLQVTADGVGHIGRLLLGGSLLGGSGFHRDDPGLNRVALCVGDGGIAPGHTENLGNVLFAGVSFFRPDSGGGDIVTCPLAAVFSGSGQLDAAVHIHGGILGRLFLGLGFLNCGFLSLGVLSLGVLSLGVLSGGILSRGILSRGILSLGLLNYGFLSRRFLGFGFLSRRFLGFGFLNRRFLDLGFLSSRLHDGRLRLGDYRGGGAEREGVGGA